MKTILCLLLVVAVWGIAHAGQFDSISDMIDDMAKTDGITNRKGQDEKPTGNNPIKTMASTFEDEAMEPMKMIDKITEGFMGTEKDKNSNKNGKDDEAKKEN